MRAIAVAAIVGTVAVATAATTGRIALYTIASASMEPTLHCSGSPGCERLRPDQVLVERVDSWLRSMHVGDVVVAKVGGRKGCSADRVVIKRIVAVGGERVAMHEGLLYVDGRPQREPYVPARARGASELRSRRVPPGDVFLLGDNRSASCDSRSFGPVPRKAIIGRVVLVLPSPVRSS